MDTKNLVFIVVCVVLSVTIISLFSNSPLTSGSVLSEDCNNCLVVYNLEEYFDISILNDFESRYGVRVQLKEFPTIEGLYYNIIADPDEVDVIIIDGFYLSKLIDNGVLMPLDKFQIPNAEHIDPKFLDLYYDRGNEFSYPYFWGTTGIAYNTKYVQEDNIGWDIFWDPQYHGKIALLDDSREFAAVALRKLGYSQNTNEHNEIMEAKEAAMQLNVKILDAMDTISFLAGREGHISQAYNGDAAAAMAANPDVKYAIPREGGTFWVDNMAVSKKGSHHEMAHIFINFMLRPDINARNVNSVKYASPLKRDVNKELINPHILNDTVIYPLIEDMSRLEIMEDVKHEDLYNGILSSYKDEVLVGTGNGFSKGMNIITTTI